MTASELFKQGQLPEAIQAQIGEVKANPGDHAKRLFLFELLAFAGDLDRARKQIDVIKYNELERDAAVAGYRRLLDAEQARHNLFVGGVAPRFFSDKVPRHAELRLQAVQALRDKRPDEAAELLRQAQDATPSVKGTLNGKPFEGLRDCDDLFGGVLEGMAQGQYFWVPLEEVESLALNPPRYPRDLIWFPARLELRQRGMGEVFLPALYPGAYQETDPELKLGRRTEFSETAPVLGKGARLFLAGDDPAPLLEWRELVIDEPTEGA
jgi:type VI secretion system protein ImpE